MSARMEPLDVDPEQFPHLAELLADGDDDPLAGVREPRRPLPTSPSTTEQLEVSRG